MRPGRYDIIAVGVEVTCPRPLDVEFLMQVIDHRKSLPLSRAYGTGGPHPLAVAWQAPPLFDIVVFERLHGVMDLQTCTAMGPPCTIPSDVY